MLESIQHRLKRMNPPRIKITYDDATDGVATKEELPFVMGVIGDYTGDNEKCQDIKDAKFTLIDKENIDKFVEYITPTLSFGVPKIIKNGVEEGKLKVDLTFKCREDFEPKSIIQQTDYLRDTEAKLNLLMEILVSFDSNEEIQKTFEQIVQDVNSLKSLKEQIQESLNSLKG